MNEIKVEKISEQKKKEWGIPESPQNTGIWSVWECEPSDFDWHYSDEEVAYVYEGKVNVETDSGSVTVNQGDLVIFPKGLSCKWHVIEKIRKVYQFR